MEHPDYNPLFDSVPAEVPLENAPLVRVIAQVRFLLSASIEKQTFIASFQEAVREVYRILRPERVSCAGSRRKGHSAGTSEQGKFEKVLSMSGLGKGRDSHKLTPLAAEAQTVRSPQKPEELVGARQESLPLADKQIRRARVAKKKP